MTPERWRQIDDLLQEALECPPEQRAAFLDRACAGDEALRKEVESLLRFQEKADNFIESPPAEVAADLFAQNQAEPVIGSLIGHYKIIGHIGRGGMGEVFLAKDKSLGRRAALKVLPKISTKDETRLLRFQQEARAASALNHPNIITIYEIGQADEIHFIATEFIEGATLRKLTGDAGMKLMESLDAAIQVAGALAAAHEAGIIHRDIKPENIMVRSDGLVKVLDFGLAKLNEQEALDRDSSADFRKVETNPGIVLGTLGYMSPEQLSGLAVDAGTDIFSLGVVLYETATGYAPFDGINNSEIILKIMDQDPPPLKQYLPEAPEELQQIVSKALAKDREKRYRTVKDMLSDLKSLRQELEPNAKRKESDRANVAPLIGSGEATIQIGSKKAEITGESGRNTAASAEYLISRIGKRSVGVTLLLLVLLAVGIGIGRNLLTAPGKRIDSIAVLPFVNTIGDPELEYLSDGIAESIINSLSQLPKLRVMARTTVFSYKGKETDPVKVGRDLKVEAVLTGRLVQQGDTLIIQTDLVDTEDGRQLWGEKYNQKVKDVISVQEEIAKQISEKLQTKLTGEEKKQLSKRYTENSEAYRLYLKGRYFWNKRTPEGFKKAIEYFEQAIDLDPNYASAYAGLADCYAVYPNYSSVARKDVFPKAKAAATKALNIDGSLAEAYTSLAYIKYYEWDFAGADSEFRRSIELNPNYATTRHWHALCLTAMGRLDEALAEIGRAVELDPFSLPINADKADILNTARLYDQSIEQYMKVIELEPNFSGLRPRMAYPYEQKGMYAEALEIYLTQRTEKEKNALSEAFKASGWKGYLKKNLELALAKEKSNQGAVSPYDVALILANLDRKEEAFEWLEKAYEIRSVGIWIKVDPKFDGIRSDPRFAALLRRLNVDPK